MGSQLKLEKINHVNQVLRDYDGAIQFYQRVFGAKLTHDFRQIWGPYDNGILAIGPVLIELFSPRDETGLGKIVGRYGDTWQAVEFKVPDFQEALQTVRERGLRAVDVNEEHGWAFTLPSDCHGLCLEIFAESMDAEPVDRNPVGVNGWKSISLAVRDIDQAKKFFLGLIAGSEVLYEEARPHIKATVAALRFGRETVELISPAGPGPVDDYLQRYREQLRGITFSVDSVAAARKHLEREGLRVVEGDAPGSVAIDPDQNYQVLWQFAE
jgi:methylmalonyl-CoA/ethylmalonyl-CoA epimerase